MKTYSVSVTIRMELGATFTVKAKSQEAAERKAEEIVKSGEFGIGSWAGTKATEALEDIEMVEADQSHELDCVEEVE